MNSSPAASLHNSSSDHVQNTPYRSALRVHGMRLLTLTTSSNHIRAFSIAQVLYLLHYEYGWDRESWMQSSVLHGQGLKVHESLSQRLSFSCQTLFRLA